MRQNCATISLVLSESPRCSRVPVYEDALWRERDPHRSEWKPLHPPSKLVREKRLVQFPEATRHSRVGKQPHARAPSQGTLPVRQERLSAYQHLQIDL